MHDQSTISENKLLGGDQRAHALLHPTVLLVPPPLKEPLLHDHKAAVRICC